MQKMLKTLENMLWLGNGEINDFPDQKRMTALVKEAKDQNIEAWTLLTKLNREKRNCPNGTTIAKWAYMLDMPRERFHELWSKPEIDQTVLSFDTGDKQILFHMETDRLHHQLQPFSYYVEESRLYSSESPYIHELYYYARHVYPDMDECTLQTTLLELIRPEEELDFAYLATLPWLEECKIALKIHLDEHSKNYTFKAREIIALIENGLIDMETAWRSVRLCNIEDILDIADYHPEAFKAQFERQPFVHNDFIENARRYSTHIEHIFEKPIPDSHISFWTKQWSQLAHELLSSNNPEHQLWARLNPPDKNTLEGLPRLTRESINRFEHTHRIIAAEQIHKALTTHISGTYGLDNFSIQSNKKTNAFDLVSIFAKSPKYWDLVSSLPNEIIQTMFEKHECVFLLGGAEHEHPLPKPTLWNKNLAELLLETYLRNIDKYVKTKIPGTMIDTLTQSCFGMVIGEERRHLLNALLLEKYCEYANINYETIKEQIKVMDSVDLLHAQAIQKLLEPQESALEIDIDVKP